MVDRPRSDARHRKFVGKAANSRHSKTKTAVFVCLSVCLDNGTDQSKFGELITKQPTPTGVLLFWFYRYTAKSNFSISNTQHGGE